MTIIVPYRDRSQHLTAFLKHMAAYLPGAAILVVEQADNRPFNRAALINVGFLECQPDYLIAHDVDMLPLTVDYRPTPGVTQLAYSTIQRHGYLGGVTMFDADTFRQVGGYNNDYYHRAEDNEMAANLHRLGIPVLNRFGEFDLQPHERTGPEFIPWLWTKSKRPRVVQDQLGACRYEVIEREPGHLKIIL
jgi:glycosyl transferase family 7 (putative galactosyltransferase)